VLVKLQTERLSKPSCAMASTVGKVKTWACAVAPWLPACERVWEESLMSNGYN